MKHPGYADPGSGGGMMSLAASPTTVVNSAFLGDWANTDGGGMFNEGPTTLMNCTLSGNWAGNNGGGVYNRDSDVAISNCAIGGNSASNVGGGVYIFFFANVILSNSILWENSDAFGMDEAAQLLGDGLIPIVDFSCIQGWTGILGGQGNMGDDPLLLDADGPDDLFGTQDDDYHLQAGSPCVEAGDPDFVLDPQAPHDVDGEPRIMGCAVEMGVDEVVGGTPIPGDLDDDGVVGPSDIPLFVSTLLGNGSGTDECVADMNGDGKLDGEDLQPFVNALLTP